MSGAPARNKTPIAAFPPDVRWIVEEWGIRVFHVEKGQILSLEYPEAAVWDLLSRDPREETIVSKLSAILAWPESRSRGLLRSSIRRWLDLEVLRKPRARG